MQFEGLRRKSRPKKCIGHYPTSYTAIPKCSFLQKLGKAIIILHKVLSDRAYILGTFSVCKTPYFDKFLWHSINYLKC